MAAILALYDALGGGQGLGVDGGIADDCQQQVEDLSLVACRGLDDKGGVGTAGIGVPLAAERLQALFQPAFACFVDATEQQVLKQVWQLFLLAVEIIQAHADH
ncbi:hypothetical protein D3C75_1223210 [compost metagenome]